VNSKGSGEDRSLRNDLRYLSLYYMKEANKTRVERADCAMNVTSIGGYSFRKNPKSKIGFLLHNEINSRWFKEISVPQMKW
jgi:hypothetical protein